MKVRQIKRYNTPKYPDKQMVMIDQDLLKKLPKRWKGNPYVGIALTSLLCLSLTACSQENKIKDKTKATAELKLGLIAPLFKHGDGRGSFGCDSVVPPAFLSEEEAFQAIYEEAKKEGLIFEKNAVTIKGVGIPVTHFDLEINAEGTYSEDKKMETKEGSLELDGNNSKKNIGFEFVSSDDYRKWSSQAAMSTVESFQTLAAAETLRSGMKEKTDNKNIGIFYDPMITSTVSFENNNGEKSIEEINIELEIMKSELKDKSIQNLKDQVHDFINWLKAQGIL